MQRRSRKKKEPDFFADVAAWLKHIGISIKSAHDRLPGFHQKVLVILIPAVLILMLLPYLTQDDAEVTSPDIVRTEVAINTASLSTQGSAQSTTIATELWKEHKVQSGDTLAKVFRANNLPMSDFQALVAVEGIDKPLSKIKTGQLIRYKLTPGGELDILQLEKENDAIMFFRLSDGGFGRSQ